MPTIHEAIERIKTRGEAKVGPNTNDTIKCGNPKDELRGIACMFLASRAALDAAVQAGANLVITHEPTFYNHNDDTGWLKGDPVYEAKRQFLEQHKLVVWRLHDLPHMARPDMIVTGMAQALEFAGPTDPEHPSHFPIAPRSLRELARHCEEKLGIRGVRFAGDPDMPCARVALRVGSPGGRPQTESLMTPGVDVVITGESPEWETCEYVRDAAAAGQRKGLIVLGHANSEEAGVRWITGWIRGIVTEVPVTHIVTGDPFTFLH
jgi:putative NIF3 family GTP cyclohydrolase 1 type 2